MEGTTPTSVVPLAAVRRRRTAYCNRAIDRVRDERLARHGTPAEELGKGRVHAQIVRCNGGGARTTARWAATMEDSSKMPS